MIFLATSNFHKVEEIKRLLPGIELAPRPGWIPEVIEDGGSFEENSIKKAKAIALATGSPAISDDSGLVVDALGGSPGVHSARYAGENATDEENLWKLLSELLGVSNRSARFVCVATYFMPNESFVTFKGEVEGRLLDSVTGHGGFGYDPIFVPDSGDGRSFAEMSMDEKALYSHRSRAFMKLRDYLNFLHQA